MRKEPVPAQRSAHSNLALDDNGRCNNTALRKATRRVSQLYDAILAPTGLRSTQRSIMLNIARFGSPTMSELAVSLVLDRSALGHNLKPLERDGLVVLEVDPNDRRNRLAKLTQKGRRKLRETAVSWGKAQERFESRFGVARAKALREALAIIAAEDFDEVVGTRSAPPAGRKRAKPGTTA